MSPSDRIEVVVKPHNRYGEHKAGDTLMVTWRELDMHPHCLEVARPIVEGPRTAIVTMPADRAAELGLPLGRRKEGPVVFEVTRLKPDGKPQLPLREELSRAAPVNMPFIGKLADAVAATAKAMGYDGDDDGVAAYVADNIDRCIQTLKDRLSDAEQDAADRANKITKLSQKNDEWRSACDGLAAERDSLNAKLVDLQQALRVSQEETQAARDEATRLAQELAQLKAPEAAPEQAQTKGRSK